jgi:hypothetical protein
MLDESSDQVDQQNDVDLLWNAIAYVPAYSDQVIIKVFIGGAGAVQIKHFSTAWSRLRLQIKYKIEYINTEDIRKLFAKPSDLVDWFLNSHVHFILAHIHQGISQKYWCMDELRCELIRLKFHNGFPNGDELQCPIFTQNKYKYLKAIEEFANPTLAIVLKENYDYSSIHDEVKRLVLILLEFLFDFFLYNLLFTNLISFMLNNNEGCGWVVKAPYTTNSEFVKFAKSFEDIFFSVNLATTKYFGNIPYMLLQPRMKNRKEYKVVVLNERPTYISYNPKDSGSDRKAFSKPPYTDLLEFADIALQKLKKNCPETISDGLIRVDIFQNENKKFIVNEFESLDANYAANEGNMVKDSITSESLNFYWMQKIEKIFAQYT